MTERQIKVCKHRHTFYKSSDCPVCPICEKLKKSSPLFPDMLGGPARRAMLNAGIDTTEKLAKFSEKEILKLHGLGKASLPVLRKALAADNLQFRAEE